MPLVVSLAQHIGQRAEQQDAVRLRDGVPGFPVGTVAVIVADGMGGHSGGAEASRVASDVFVSALARTSHAEPAADVLHRATGEAGRSVHAAARQAGVEDDMGTTLVAAIVEPERFAWVSVGDSAVYHATPEGLLRLSTPHTLGTRLDRAVTEGRIAAGDAASHAQRHALTSFLGQAHLNEIDGAVEPVPLKVGERLLLCSDGLFGTLSDAEMAAVLAAVVPERAAQALVDAALSRGRPRQDNVSAIVVTRVADLPSTPAVTPSTPRPPAWRPLLWFTAVVAAVAGGVFYWQTQQTRPAVSPGARDSVATFARPDSVRSDSLRPDSLAATGQRADSLARRDSARSSTPEPARPFRPDTLRRPALLQPAAPRTSMVPDTDFSPLSLHYDAQVAPRP